MMTYIRSFDSHFNSSVFSLFFTELIWRKKEIMKRNNIIFEFNISAVQTTDSFKLICVTHTVRNSLVYVSYHVHITC